VEAVAACDGRDEEVRAQLAALERLTPEPKEPAEQAEEAVKSRTRPNRGIGRVP